MFLLKFSTSGGKPARNRSSCSVDSNRDAMTSSGLWLLEINLRFLKAVQHALCIEGES